MSATSNLSAQNPWPGLQAYAEEDHPFFFGRDAEVDQLLWLVRRNALTVVFGPSGTGKSSLVRAGLFPKLRIGGAEPRWIRLKHDDSLVEQVQSELNLTGETLWEGFHRLPKSPEQVVVFDQFEEIFTLGDARPKSEEFLTELANLVENYYPVAVRERLARGEMLDFEYEHQAFHILLVLREDFVWRLDGLRARMPSVMRARFVVPPFSEEQAREAVKKPGREVVENEVAEQIVQFAASQRGSHLVDPAILSLLCRELNKGRSPGSKISPGQFDGDSETILSKFWEDSIAALDAQHRQKVRKFVEDRLVSPNGFRTAAPRDEVESCSSAIDALIDGRLLRSEERFGTPHLELTHDVLCPVVSKTREERRQHGEAERRSKEAREKLVQVAAALLLALMLVAVGFAVWAVRAQREANALRKKAVDSAAEAVANRNMAETNERAAKESEKQAKASAADENKQRVIASQEKEAAQTALSRSSVQDAADLAATYRAPEAMAHLARALRIDHESVGARSWFTDLVLRETWLSPLYSLQHGGSVNSAAFSLDGRLVVTASSDNTARVWNADTGGSVGVPLQHEDRVHSAAFGPDGRRVVTASNDHTARVWETNTGKLVGTLQHQDNVNSAAFSPDGRRVVTASSDHTARVWESETGKPVGAPLQHRDKVHSAAFSPDGRRVVTASDDDTAQLWEADTGNPVGAPLQHQDRVFSAVFSPDGRRVVTVSWGYTAQVWESDTSKLVLKLQHDAVLLWAVFSPDGRRVLTAAYDHTARVWQADTGKLEWTLQHENSVNSARFSPDGRRVVTASDDRTARVWEANTGKPVGVPLQHEDRVQSAMFSPDGRRVVTASGDQTARVSETDIGKPGDVPLQHEASVNSAVFSPDGRRVVTASDDHTARVWETNTGKLVRTLQHQDHANSAVFSPDGRRVVTASSDHTARVWESETGKPVGAPLQHPDKVHSAAFSPDGRRVVTTSDDHTARVWETNTGKLVRTLQHQDHVNSAVFSPDGRRVVTAADDLTARVWDSDTGKPIGKPMQHRRPVQSAAFSPDGRRVVTTSFSGGLASQADNMARMWQADTGKPVGVPLQHPSLVYSATFSLDGRRVVTASYDHTARVWDAVTGKPVGAPMQHNGVVWSAVFSPDGRRVVTASEDHTARVWDAVTGKPVGAPMQHNGVVWSAVFSPDGRSVVTASGHSATVWTVLLGSGDPQDARFMADFGEALGGYHVNEFGSLVPLDDQLKRLESIRKYLSHATDHEGTLTWFLRRFFAIR